MRELVIRRDPPPGGGPYVAEERKAWCCGAAMELVGHHLDSTYHDFTRQRLAYHAGRRGMVYSRWRCATCGAEDCFNASMTVARVKWNPFGP